MVGRSRGDFLAILLKQGHLHEVVHIETLLRLFLEAAFDELNDLLVLTFPLGLAEVKVMGVCNGRFQSYSTCYHKIKNGANTPNISLGCDAAVVLSNFWRHEQPIDPAHLLIDAQMLRHIDQLHHRDVRYMKLDGSVVDRKTLGHDDALGAEILVHQMMMVQIGKLA